MNVLLHVCCGPCATATAKHWREEGLQLTAFFCNPNVHPFLEFRRRLTGVRDWAADAGISLLEDLSYDPSAWFAQVAQPGEDRCRRCIALRLDQAALVAAQKGCQAITTSLAISPWQNHSVIQEEGSRSAGARGLKFIYEDLRRLYPRSRAMAKELGLYQQKYCGCLLSEWERYRES